MDEKYPTNMSQQPILGQTISRRQMLGTITATAGFTAVGVLASPASGNASVEIVTLRKGDGTPERTAKVPQKWLQHEKQAREEVKQLKDRYSDKNWVRGVGIGPSTQSVAGKPASVLQVKADGSTKKGRDKTKRNRKVSLPDSNGISVEARRVNHVKLAGACHHNGNYEQVWGGDICGRGPVANSWGTAGYYVRKGGNRYLLHCNHVFGQAGACIDPDDMKVYQGGGKLGKVVGHHQAHDWVVIEDGSGSTSFAPDPKIWVGDHGVNVNSWVTEAGLSQFKSNGTTCYKQGVTTGLQSGTIRGVGVQFNDQCISLPNAVELTCNGAKGDSGGPIFITYNNGNSIALIGHNVYVFDEFLDDGLGYGCGDYKIEPFCGGWPTWRFVQEDYGGQYTIDTS